MNADVPSNHLRTFGWYLGFRRFLSGPDVLTPWER